MRLFDLRAELKSTAKKLNVNEIDVDYIVAEILSVPRTELALIDDVSSADEKKIRKLCATRFKHIPLDKILKRTYFYGLEFMVNENVLTPRQDSELLVDISLNLIKENSLKSVLDLCTGSGCLAIAIKKNVDIDVDAVDISKKAFKVAKINAKKNGTNINIFRSNMLDCVENSYDLILSNPPYIKSKEIGELDQEVREHDPLIALDGGADGLDFYREIHDNVNEHLNSGGFLVLEIGEGQSEDIKDIFKDFKFVSSSRDYNGIIRVLVFRKES